MKIQHLFLVLFVVLVWGVNFVAVRIALDVLPPLLLCAIRFTLAALPLVFFLPKPDAPFKFILAYGLLTFAVQFGLLFTGIYLGISPGLAGVILQVQVFFSMALATTFLGERLRAFGDYAGAFGELGGAFDDLADDAAEIGDHLAESGCQLANRVRSGDGDFRG